MANATLQAMTAKAAQLSVKALKAELVKLQDDLSDVADLMTAALLGALEQKMPEAEFVGFVDAL